MSIKLVNNRGFKWEKHGKLSIKGFYHNPIDRYSEKELNLIKSLFKDAYTTVELLDLLNNSEHIVEVLDYVNILNGQFALVIENEHSIFAAVDNIRSIPIFYSEANGVLELSDSPFELLSDGENLPDKLALIEYEISGNAWANRTLHSEINSLSAGEYLFYNKNSKELIVEEYMRFSYREDFNQSEETSIDRIKTAYSIAAKRLAALADGDTIMLPLSGGEDSRIVAHTLKSIGYENVICYSYGLSENAESNLSKSIAEHLGYNWIFAPFDDLDWREWYLSEEYADFSKYASNLVSTPHFQDYHAVKYFKEHNMIPENAIFAPGHSGDFIHGDHIPSVFINSKHLDIDYIVLELFRELAINKEFTGNSKQFRNILNEIKKEIRPEKNASRNDMISYYEFFDWKEKQSKMIANSVRVYEYFGYRWHMMLWNRTVFEAWETVVPELRYHRRLHYKIVTEIQSDLRAAIGATGTGNPDGGFKNKLKDIIRKMAPNSYRKIFFNYKNKNLKNEYDGHHLDWYKIKTKSEFDQISSMYSTINGIVSSDMLARFSSDFNWKNNGGM